MQLVRTMRTFPFARVANGSVLTIGAFDGLHVGHRRLLDRVVALAHRHDLPAMVMSFEPTPREFFSADAPPARLMKFREKFEALAALGIDVFYCPRFDAQMRDMDVASFIRRLLAHTLNTRFLIVGDDFRFARRREGSMQDLERVRDALGLVVEQAPSVVLEGERVSSTAIRNALRAGNLSHAELLLGRPYRISGRVVRGKRLGRQLGYPTANLNLQRKQSAVLGIFAVRVHGLAGGERGGVASVGTRPTFNGVVPILEVHIFDFDEDIYGHYIHVEFVEHLRNEERFESADDLVAQMHEDARRARAILAA